MLPLIPYNGILRPAIFAGFVFLTVLIVNGSKKRSFRGRANAAFFVYFLLLVYITFLSRKVGESYSYRLSPLNSMQEAFARDPDTGWICLSKPEALEAIALNLLLLMPLGYLLPLLFPRLSRWQVIGIGFLTTGCIELGQFITKLGMFDIDDILYNVVGLWIGYLITKALKKKCQIS